MGAGATRYVSPTGNDAAACNSAAPCLTIAAGVAKADPGDTIRVAAGTYGESSVVVAKPLKFRGAQAGVDARDRSVSAGSESDVTNGFDLRGGDVVIDGFTAGSPAAGGGVDIDGSGEHLIENSILHNSQFGVFTLNPSSVADYTVRQNLIENNDVGTDGIGIFAQGAGDAIIEDNLFRGNTSSGVNGSGQNGSIVVDGNTFASGATAGVLVNTADARFTNNDVATPTGSQLYVGGGNTNTLVQGNTFRRTGATTATASGVSFANDFGGPPVSKGATVVGNTFVGQNRAISVAAGAFQGPLQVRTNRFTGTLTAAIRDRRAAAAGSTVNAENNFFGCNGGPGQTGCAALEGENVGAIDASPSLALSVSAEDGVIVAGGAGTPVTATFAVDSAGNAVDVSDFPATSVAFASTLGTISSPVTTTAGSATSVLRSGVTTGTATVIATVDTAAPTTTVGIVSRAGTPGAPGPAGATGQTGPAGPTGGVLGTSTSSNPVAIGKGKLRVRKGHVRLKLNCPAGSGLCETRVTLTAKGKRVGGGTVVLRAGRTTTVRLRVVKASKRKGVKQVKVAVLSRDRSGAATQSTRKVRIR